MNITFVLNYWDRSGGVRVIIEYANRLQEQGHQVHIVYPFIPLFTGLPATPKNIINQALVGVKHFAQWVRRKSAPWSTRAGVRVIPVWSLHPVLVRLVERRFPDAHVVVATAWRTAYVVNSLSPRKGDKLYFVQHYEIGDMWSNEQCWKQARRVRYDNEPYGLAMASVVPQERDLIAIKDLVDRSYKLPLRKIVIAEWLRRLIVDKFSDRVEAVIHNGVNFEVFYQQQSIKDKEEQIRVLMPCRTAKWKGLEDGLEALKHVKARFPSAHFTIYGDQKSSLGILARKIPGWIEHKPNISDDELRELFNETDIFVFPSWVEGFPLPPMEAMACGCAIASTDAGGSLDYLDGAAVITPIQNPAALADSICMLIEDERERERIAERGHQLIQQFTWEKAARRFEGVLRDRA